MDHYLEKLQRDEVKIREQIDAQLAAGFDVKPSPDERKKIETAMQPEPPAGAFVQLPSGLYVPPSLANSAGWYSYDVPADSIKKFHNEYPEQFETNYSGAFVANKQFQEQVYKYPVIKTDADTIQKSLADASNYMFGIAAQMFCNCPTCRAKRNESTPEERDAAALRGYHGRDYEYVYSDILKCHVRIGEPIKTRKSHE